MTRTSRESSSRRPYLRSVPTGGRSASLRQTGKLNGKHYGVAGDRRKRPSSSAIPRRFSFLSSPTAYRSGTIPRFYHKHLHFWSPAPTPGQRKGRVDLFASSLPSASDSPTGPLRRAYVVGSSLCKHRPVREPADESRRLFLAAFVAQRDWRCAIDLKSLALPLSWLEIDLDDFPLFPRQDACFSAMPTWLTF